MARQAHDQGCFNMQFHSKCAALQKLCSSTEKLCCSKVCYLVAEGCKGINTSRNGKFGHEMISEIHPKIALLEVATVIFPFNFSTQHHWTYCTVINFSLINLHMTRANRL